MHHVYISTAMLVAGLFLSAIITIIVAGVVSIKRDRQHHAVTPRPDTLASLNAMRNIYPN